MSANWRKDAQIISRFNVGLQEKIQGIVRPVQVAHGQPEQARIKWHQQNSETKTRAGQLQVG